MSVPILIETTDGQFAASLVGVPGLRCVRPSKAEAIGALQHALALKVKTGELVDLDLGDVGISGLAGRFQNDPTLIEIREQIYRDREADRQ
jgi:hypothetical protein